MTLLFKKHASNEDWTHDLWFTRPTLCHWAIEALAEWTPPSLQKITFVDKKWSVDAEIRQLAVGQLIRLWCSWHKEPRIRANWFSLLRWEAEGSAQRRWYNGQHSCLPSSWSGFDSRPTQTFLSKEVKIYLVGKVFKMDFFFQFFKNNLFCA